MLHAAHGVHPHATGWKDTLGRVGLAGRGALYAVIALLALELAIGSPGGEASPKGAIAWIATHPFGKVLLVVLTAALFALALWRFLDAAVGDPVEGDDVSDRVRFAAKGAVYLSFAIAALSMTIADWGGGSAGSSASGGDQSQKEATAFVLGWPGGQWIVAAVGLGMLGYAVFMFKHHAVDASFTKRLDRSDGHIRSFGRFGYGARSVVWAVVGVLLVQAAVTFDANRAGGLSSALLRLASTTGGPWLLGAVALGLFAFAAFCVEEAMHRRAA